MAGSGLVGSHHARANLFATVTDSVSDPRTQVSVALACRLDSNAEVGDEVGFEFSLNPEIAQYIDEDFAHDWCGIITNCQEFRDAVRRRVGERVGIKAAAAHVARNEPASAILPSLQSPSVDSFIVSHAHASVAARADSGIQTLLHPAEVEFLHVIEAHGLIGNGGMAYWFENRHDPLVVANAADAIGLQELGAVFRRSAEMIAQTNPPEKNGQHVETIGKIVDDDEGKWTALNDDAHAALRCATPSFDSLAVRHLARVRSELPYLRDLFLVRDELILGGPLLAMDRVGGTSRVATLVVLLAVWSFHEFLLGVPDAAECADALDAMGLHDVAAVARQRLAWFERGIPITKDEQYRVENAMYQSRSEIVPLLASHLRSRGNRA